MTKQKKLPRVVFTGSHGTGKTTMLDRFREDYPVITEVVRELIKKGVDTKNAGLDTQMIIWNEYKSRFEDQEEYISDRAFLDVLAYTYFLYDKDPEKYKDIIKQMRMEIRAWMVDYKPLIVYFPIEFDIIDDGVRPVDPEYQRVIDGYIQDLLNDPYTCPYGYYTIRGTEDQREATLRRILSI